MNPSALYEQDEEVNEVINSAPSDDDLAMFRQQVAEWLKLDDHIRKLTIALRERKVHQKALGAKIQEFMTTNNYDNLNTQQGRIKASTREVKKPVRLQEIKSTLMELADTRLTGQELLERIFEGDRPTVVKQSLRRIVPKVSLHLDI